MRLIKNREFFEFLSQMNFHFRSEDINEIHFDFNCKKSELDKFILDLNNKFKGKFVVIIDDQSVSIPTESHLIETILKTMPKDDILSIFRFKKHDIVSSEDNTNSLIYYDYNNLLNYISNLSFEDFQNIIFNNKTFLDIYIVENFDATLIQNQFIKIQDIKYESTENTFSSKSLDFKKEIQEKFLRLSSWGSTKPLLIPDQLFFSVDSNSNLIEVFNKWCSFLCVSYVSSYSEKTFNSDKYIFHFNAQKKVILETTYDLKKRTPLRKL